MRKAMPWDWRSPGLPKLQFGDFLIMDDFPELPLMDSAQSAAIKDLLQRTSDLASLSFAYRDLDQALTESIHAFRQSIGLDVRQVVAVIDGSSYAIGIKGDLDDGDYKMMALRLPTGVAIGG
jgi:hypothetical protein